MAEVTRYCDYDAFAWLYAHYWGGEFHTQIVPMLERLVLRLLPKGARVLDLCCGDGRIAQALHKRGYQVTGLDGSEQMLVYARKMAPQVPFHLADARDFTFDQPFDAVISTFDSLNHVMTRRELQKVFRNVYSALGDGGYFAFDINREEAYRELWSNMSSVITEQAVSIARGEFDARRGVATCDITQFAKLENVWVRSDYTLRQKLHQHTHVMDDLEKAGFTQAACYDATSDLGMSGDIGRHRTFYLARK